jgi:hypothetical protein
MKKTRPNPNETRKIIDAQIHRLKKNIARLEGLHKMTYQEERVQLTQKLFMDDPE